MCSARPKAPLYRKVNTRTWGVRHGSGQKAAYARNTKAGPERSMHAGQRHGRDYTPLFRFLLSKVGQDWDAVHAEAVSRLDDPAPVFWMVATSAQAARPVIRTGESSYWSGLCVDGENRLQKVAPGLGPEHLHPQCACCTHTLNGVVVPNRFDPDDPKPFLAAV